MKIALVLHPISDYGGIINHVEDLGLGLKELGHDVSLYKVLWEERANDSKLDHSEQGTFFPVNQSRGWSFPKENKLLYKKAEDKQRTLQILSGYDLVIW
jgi:hypothetical protein